MSAGSLVANVLTLGLRALFRHLDKDKPPDPWRTAKRVAAFCIWLLAVVFILWANHFHPTASAVFLCIGFTAVELAVINLFRTGARAVGGGMSSSDLDDSTWGRPVGARAELEREKKSLLKAIKEAEFDREMGKLSKADSDEMIGLYRARAIEVIKELDRLGGDTGTVREQIEREVKARLELEGRGKAKAKAEKKRKADKVAAKTADKPAEKTAEKSEAAAEKPAPEKPVEKPAEKPAPAKPMPSVAQAIKAAEAARDKGGDDQAADPTPLPAPAPEEVTETGEKLGEKLTARARS